MKKNSRDVYSVRAWHAILAICAGNILAVLHAFRHVLKELAFFVRQRNERRECAQIVIKMFFVGHSAKDCQHLRKRPGEAKRHAAALSYWRFCFICASTFCVTLANLPPSNGSMTTTGMSRSANSSYRYSALVSSPIAFCQSAL